VKGPNTESTQRGCEETKGALVPGGGGASAPGRGRQQQRRGSCQDPCEVTTGGETAASDTWTLVAAVVDLAGGGTVLLSD